MVQDPSGAVCEGPCGCVGILQSDGVVYLARTCRSVKLLLGFIPLPADVSLLPGVSANDELERHVEDFMIVRPLDIEEVG